MSTDHVVSDSEVRYVRPTHTSKLTSEEKTQLLLEHFSHYAEVIEKNPAGLTAKVPRRAFEELLNRIGCLLLEESKRLAAVPGPVRDFLEENPLPPSMSQRLPPEFRVFCLAINALKQWIAAEQSATDRYLLGGTARARCRAVAKTCLVTGEPLEPKTVQLHHPVRDGRPPIPLSTNGHAAIENQLSGITVSRRDMKHDDAIAILKDLKSSRTFSWVMLRRGCLDQLGQPANHTTPAVGASSRTFARKAIQASGLTAQQILDWLDANNLGASTKDGAQ
jgi:hypothetical protein